MCIYTHTYIQSITRPQTNLTVEGHNHHIYYLHSSDHKSTLAHHFENLIPLLF